MPAKDIIAIPKGLHARLANTSILTWQIRDAMNWLDIVLLIIIGLVAAVGYRVGLVQAATTLVGILIAIVLASRFHDNVDGLVSTLTSNENAQEVGGYILIFVVVLLASLVAGAVVRKVLNVLMLNWVDKLGGFALGVIIAFAVASAAMANVQSFPVLDLEESIEDSAIGSFLADNFDVVLRGVRILPKGYGT